MAADPERGEGVMICPNCSGPAEFLDTRRAAAMEAVCEECARHDSAHDAGQVRTSVSMITVAVAIGSDAGMTPDEIRATLERALQTPCHEIWELSTTDLSAVPSWADTYFEHDTRFVPLDGGES